MHVGIVLPVKYLHLGGSNFHLCYASLLHIEEYVNYYKGKERVILDTSPVLPRQVDPILLEVGVRKINPSIVILPSVDFSYEKTVEAARGFLGRVKVKYCIGVIQGLDLQSLQYCYLALRDLCGIIGLPSPLETVARRDEIARDLHIKEKTLYIEIYKNPYEEIPPKDSMGIFTSYPARLAADLRRLSEYNPTPPPLDFGKEDVIEELISANIEEYLEVIKYAGS